MQRKPQQPTDQPQDGLCCRRNLDLGGKKQVVNSQHLTAVRQRDRQHALALPAKIMATALAAAGLQIVHPAQHVTTNGSAAHAAAAAHQTLGL